MESLTVNIVHALLQFAVLYRLGVSLTASQWALVACIIPPALIAVSAARKAREAKHLFQMECLINMRLVRDVAYDTMGIAPSNETILTAWRQMQEVFTETRKRGYTVTDIGYTWREYLKMLTWMKYRCREAGIFDPKPLFRPSFLPSYASDGTMSLLYVEDLADDDDLGQPIRSLPPLFSRAMLAPQLVPKFAKIEGLALDAETDALLKFDFTYRRFVRRTPDVADPPAIDESSSVTSPALAPDAAVE